MRPSRQLNTYLLPHWMRRIPMTNTAPTLYRRRWR
nr:MAG TPA: hypothetical protein [Caudoviricetes sp.]